MIVIPMAGLSRRFAEAGFAVPKYMLEAHGRTLFHHSVASFARYFGSVEFLFVVRDVQDTVAFVHRECAALGVASFRVVALDAPTAGQAETVAAGLRAYAGGDAPLTIFNIDTFRPGFRFPTEPFDPAKVDGYLEVFRGSGANWSYVGPAEGDEQRVARTTEKVPISDLCCTGLYHFASSARYLAAFDAFRAGAAARLGLSELYVAPMYNLLIGEGADIRYDVVAAHDVVFCGVPDEYAAFLASPAG